MEEIKDRAFVTIEKAGLMDTLQDGGRHGYQSQGVPISGAMDTYSYTIGNLLLMNNPNAVSVEITLIGPRIHFTHSTRIVITGADLSPKINGRAINMWQPIQVHENNVLTFGNVIYGCRSYISIQGGFQVPQVLGSASTYTKGKLGGIRGQKLQKGDSISYQPDCVSSRMHNIALAHDYRRQTDNRDTIELRVVVGPQAEYFSTKGLREFFTESYVTSIDMDRMGLRLQGKPIEFACEEEIITDAVTYGAIQVPTNGQPVILGADCQTTGGYAKIGCVISVDLPKVAQLRPLQCVRFSEISVEDAQELYRKQQRFYLQLAKFIY